MHTLENDKCQKRRTSNINTSRCPSMPDKGVIPSSYSYRSLNSTINCQNEITGKERMASQIKPYQRRHFKVKLYRITRIAADVKNSPHGIRTLSLTVGIIRQLGNVRWNRLNNASWAMNRWWCGLKRKLSVYARKRLPRPDSHHQQAEFCEGA